MNKKFRQFLKELNATATMSYSEIIEKMQKSLHGRINIRTVDSKGSEKRDEDISGYIDKIIDEDERLFIGWRISAHLPDLQNEIKMNNTVPADSEYGHISLLMLGTNELEKLRIKKSEYNNYTMGNSRTTVRVRVSHPVYAYYQAQLPKDIPYRIYHFVTDLLTENDLRLITNATEKWLSGDGNVEFKVPDGLSQNVYYKKHSKSKTSSIDCKMHIVRDASVNESDIRVTAGNGSVMSVDMGSVTIVSPEGEEMTLHATLEVKSCSNRDVDVLNALRFGLGNDSDNTDDFSLSDGDKERFDESAGRLLNNEQQRLFEAIMNDVAKVVKRRIQEME